ncbi:DUF2061 domain-containing protein [Moraxella boevrei]|uniref:DUF2061 domain-containing protein n=1 Tax=Faucicola boevrei TaxID=346665 RepID=UPI003736868C
MSPNIPIQKTLQFVTKTHNRQAMTKTVSFAVLHFCVAFSVAYMLTGSVLIGSLMALIEPAINTVAFFFHEKFWQKIQHKSVISTE